MSSPTRRLGAIFVPDLPPEQLRPAVAAAEEAGISELWLWEDCFREAAFSSAGAALAWSETLRIGIGIAPMPLRNVALTAMEIATLERMFPGRLLPGVGHGVLSWMSQVGARVASPLTLMREYVPALQRLLAGEEVSTDGRYVHLDAVRLDWPPVQAPPVYAAGEGPKTLALTGEVADGTVLTGGTSPERTAEARALVDAARSHAGREGDHPIVVYVAAATGPDASARAAAQLEEWGVPGESHRIAIGTVDDVARRLGEFYDAGADAVILQPVQRDGDVRSFLVEVAEIAGALNP